MDNIDQKETEEYINLADNILDERRKKDMEKLLSIITKKQLGLLVMYLGDQFTIKDIALRLGCSISNVQRILYLINDLFEKNKIPIIETKKKKNRLCIEDFWRFDNKQLDTLLKLPSGRFRIIKEEKNIDHDWD